LKINPVRASEKSFAGGYGDRYRALLAYGTLVETCIACLYRNQNLDKTSTI